MRFNAQEIDECLKAVQEICGPGYIAAPAAEGLVVIKEKCPRQEAPQSADDQLELDGAICPATPDDEMAPKATPAPANLMHAVGARAAKAGDRAPRRRAALAAPIPAPAPPAKPIKKKMKKYVRPNYGAGLRLEIGADKDQWVSIPEAGCFQGFCVVGAPGTGKTSGAIYPMLHQLIGHPSRPGGLVLEVKGNMGEYVRKCAVRYGRLDDIVVIRPGGPVSYNPLFSDAPAEFLASRLTEATINLAGGMDPREAFWIQSAEDVSRNIIRLKRMTTGYVTMENIFVLATDDEGLAREMGELDALVEAGEVSKEEAAGVSMWYVKWANMEGKMKNSIVGEVTRFTNLFVDSLEFRKTFCPAHEDITFAGFEDCMNKGQIVILDMPPQKYGNAASSVATLIKLDYFDTVLRRTMTENDEQVAKTYEMLALLGGRSEYKLREELSDLRRTSRAPDPQRLDRSDRRKKLESTLDVLAEIQDDKQLMKIARSAKSSAMRRYIYMERLAKAGTLAPGDEKEKSRLWVEILSVTQDWLACRSASAGVAGALNRQRPVFFVCDEYQNFVSGGGLGTLKSDNLFYDRSRESRCINLVAFQDYTSLTQKLRWDVARNILACLQNKLWLRVGCPLTALAAAEACRDEEGCLKYKPGEFLRLPAYESIFSGTDGFEKLGPMKITLPRHYEIDSLPGLQVR